MANGFYGSLSKLQKINFQFDRVFPNRATMDAEAGSTGLDLEGNKQDFVLNGRYVLVDYNEGDTVDITLKLGYKQDGNIYAGFNVPFPQSSINIGDNIIVIGEFDNEGNYEKYADEEIWTYTAENTFEQKTQWNTDISNSDTSTYEHNLIIDNSAYPNAGRGWDSTVWQKTYQNGKSTYIMIAELNALSPTLAIAPDPPGQDGIPSSPYFSDSTPNFYRLHIGSQWGLRLRGAQQYASSAYLSEEKRNIPFTSDIDNYILPSDVSGSIYLKDRELKDKPLAIYYNKKGFNKFLGASNGYADLDSKIEYYKARENQLTPEEEAIYRVYKNTQGYIEKIDPDTENKIENKNFISLTPTGISGKIYSNVDRDGGSNAAPDMQELSIMLPSLGETISQMWDIIYGESKSVDANGYRMYYNNPENISPEWITDNFSSDTNKFRNTDIYWNSTNGIRLNQRDGYNAEALSTLAGTLNSTHDIMGMIIRDYKEYEDADIEDINVNRWDPTKIYYVNGEYYIKNKTYEWTPYEEGDSRPLYNEILPSQMVGVGYHATKTIIKDNGTEEIVEVPLYRLSSEEFPIILDNNVSENLESYKTEFMEGSGYDNYIQVKDVSDIIEGAIYGTLDVEKATEEAQTPILENNDGEKIYYYYQDNWNDGIKRYTLENPDSGGSPTWSKGIYYTFTKREIDEAELTDTYFYMPNYFYVENIKTGEIHLALEATLDEIYGNNTTEKDWRFYRKKYNQIAPGGGSGNKTIQPIYAKDANGNYIYELSYIDINRLSEYNVSYRYNNVNNTLIIAKSFDGDTPVNLVDSIKSEYLNGIGTIVFENDELKGYYSKYYKATDGQYYLPLDFAINDGLIYEEDENENYIPSYKIASYKVVDANVLTGEGQVKVIRFQENTYFYKRDNTFILEEKNNLRWIDDVGGDPFVPGNSNGENSPYYKLTFNVDNRKQVYPVGGGYFKTERGDYIRYFAPHIPDPELMTDENEDNDFYFVTFTELQGDYRAFAENVYYTTDQLTTKATIYDPEATYYERIGNIVGESEPKWSNGMQWNTDSVPDDVTLGYITPTWKAKKLDGLNKNMTTIYGLIVQLYNKLNAGNEYNRDSNTIQGIINQASDLIVNLENLGYSFNTIKFENANGETTGELIANSNRTATIVSDSTLVPVSIESGKIKISDSKLKITTDNNIVYTDIGNLNNTNNAQIIAYSSGQTPTIQKKTNNLLFNAGDISLNSDNLNVSSNAVFASRPKVNLEPLITSDAMNELKLKWTNAQDNKALTFFDDGREILKIQQEVDPSAVEGGGTPAGSSTVTADDVQLLNSINKQFTVRANTLGTFSHETTQIQGMTTNGTDKLYICGTNGDDTQVIVYEVNVNDITRVSAHSLVFEDTGNPVYGHPNCADYCEGKLYITGCVDTLVDNKTTYHNLLIVTPSSANAWTAKLVSLNGDSWWSAAMLKAYNGKYVLAGHQADSGNLELFATIYGTSRTREQVIAFESEADANKEIYTHMGEPLGFNKFKPWRTIQMGAFSCDPAGMCQYKNYILIGDAHLNGALARNAVRCFTSEGELKSVIYLPAMGDNELEDICVINSTLYIVDISGNLYSANINSAIYAKYNSDMFSNNTAPGMQYCYVNENGSEHYTNYGTASNPIWIMDRFRLNPWFFPSKHCITDGSFSINTGGGNLILKPMYFNGGNYKGQIVFCGTGKCGTALVSYWIPYTRVSDDNEYIYKLGDTFNVTAHWNNQSYVYNTPQDAATNGYLGLWNYVCSLISEPSPYCWDLAETIEL